MCIRDRLGGGGGLAYVQRAAVDFEVAAAADEVVGSTFSSFFQALSWRAARRGARALAYDLLDDDDDEHVTLRPRTDGGLLVEPRGATEPRAPPAEGGASPPGACGPGEGSATTPPDGANAPPNGD